MQTFKTTEPKEDRSIMKVEMPKEKLPARVAGFFGENKKRVLIVLGSLAVIGGAVLLNWTLFGPDKPTGDYVTEPSADSTYVSSTDEDRTEAKDDENVENTAAYFAMAVIDRKKARDEAMEVLQTVVESEESGDPEKENALDEIQRIASDIEKEANIESLVKSKGYVDCVAVIHDNKASVIVDTDAALLVSDIAQITQIVWDQAGIKPTDLNIVEK